MLLLLTAIGFAILFAVSWQKWADLAIDGGREMNTPVRLLHGEMLYTDVSSYPVRSLPASTPCSTARSAFT